MQVMALLLDAWRDMRDKKLFWVLLVASLVVAVAFAGMRFDDKGWVMMFGAARIPMSPRLTAGVDPGQVMTAFVLFRLVDVYLAVIGLLVCLIATAGMIPEFLAPGVGDVVISKPISRWLIFATRYCGGMLFVVAQVAFFVVATLVVLRIHTGSYAWGYLWAIPLLVAQFSYLYCVSALVAVCTRRTLASVLIALLFWFSVEAVASARHSLHAQVDTQEQTLVPADPDDAGTTLRVVNLAAALLPCPTYHVPILLSRSMKSVSFTQFQRLDPFSGDYRGGDDPPRAQGWNEQIEDQVFTQVSAWRSVGGSLFFEAVVLAIAGYVFTRRDY